ncbi:MAG: hypothetical protein N2C14_14965, partial [Planctomycetales bacterium]
MSTSEASNPYSSPRRNRSDDEQESSVGKPRELGFQKQRPIHDPRHVPQGLPIAPSLESEGEAITEDELTRAAYLGRETTIRAFALSKSLTALGFLIGAVVVLATGTRLSHVLPASWRPLASFHQVTPWWFAAGLGFFALLHGGIAGCLWRRLAAGRALQGMVSVLLLLFLVPFTGVFLMTFLTPAGISQSFRVITLGSMLVTAIHAGYLVLLLGRSTQLVFSENYNDAVAQTPETPITSPVA